MAKTTYKLPEELLKRLSNTAVNMDSISEKVLKAGGEVVLKETKSQLQSVLSGTSSGQLLNALGLSDVRLDRNGNYNIKIGFAENRTDGSSNALIANVIEYGKFNQPAKPFLKRTKTSSKSACIAAMTDKLEEELNKL